MSSHNIQSTASPSTTTPCGISALHGDIIDTKILTRLDGPTLASLSSTSTEFHAHCLHQNLWQNICNSQWPSISDDQRVRQVIATLPDGYRSFFSDSFPSLHHFHHSRRLQTPMQSPATTELISAVDLRYGNDLVYAKVLVTETLTEWFQSSPMWVDILDPKETVPTPINFTANEDELLSIIATRMSLSWIVINPTRKQAANLSSLRPVLVRRQWLTGDIQARYATVISRGNSNLVEFRVVVTCRGKEGGELHVSEVSLQVVDMDGKNLSGKEGLVILQEAMEGERRKNGKIEEERERYEEYLEMKREKRRWGERKERRVDTVCLITIIVALFLWNFWILLL